MTQMISDMKKGIYLLLQSYAIQSDTGNTALSDLLLNENKSLKKQTFNDFQEFLYRC